MTKESAVAIMHAAAAGRAQTTAAGLAHLPDDPARLGLSVVSGHAAVDGQRDARDVRDHEIWTERNGRMPSFFVRA
jgi:hypothetical protein